MPIKVLIVDDSAFVRQTLERELKELQTRMAGLRRKWSADPRQLAHPETMKEHAA